MVVKDKTGRKRYIAFEVAAKRRIEKREIIRLLNGINSRLQSELQSKMRASENKGAMPEAKAPAPLQCRGPHGFNYNTVRLIKFDGACGIIYCVHYDKDRVIELLTECYKQTDGAAPRVLGVSGTIKKATKKYLDKLNDYT